MANPIWTTGRGQKIVNLGTATVGVYFEYPLDAYDPAGGSVSYKFLAGTLPPGIRVNSIGIIQGGPNVEGVPELRTVTETKSYEFTVRASDSNGLIADKSFSMNVTNINPPTILTTNHLGEVFDGEYYSLQLEATELNQYANITWSITNGSLPGNLTITSTGLISGFIMPIPIEGNGGALGFGGAPFNEYAFSNAPFYQDTVYNFTATAFDGINQTNANYTLKVCAKDLFTADTSFTSVDNSYLTVDHDNKYVPIMSTPSESFPPVRSDSKFAFQFQAVDPNENALSYELQTNAGPALFDGGSTETYTLQSEFLYLSSTLNVSINDIITQPGTSSTGVAAIASTGNIITLSATGLSSGQLNAFANTSAYIYKNGANTNITVTSTKNNWTISNVGVAGIGGTTPGEGFDTVAWDQTNLSLPPGLVLDAQTGWLIGTIGAQPQAIQTYTFNVFAYETTYPTVQSEPITYTMTVLGDITNSIAWTTSANLGMIDNGSVSELSVSAVNNSGRALTYAMTGSSSLPQGLELNSDGLIIGRAAFEFFTLDKGTTTVDGATSMFDNTYSFQVTATTTDQTSSSSQTFSILVNNFNITPYEDVYVRALSTLDQRELFLSIVNNTDIFPTELLYRSSDPNFGVAKDIRSLFLAGLKPNEISTYLGAMNTNTYKKRIDFGDIKTAIAVDENFNVKYEVVYIQLENDFTYDVTASTSVYDKVIGKSVYNNSYANMSEVLSSNLGYANIGALPDWMTSPQSNKKVLGFTRAIVLAYTVPGASKLMAYRLGANGISFNEINFVVDRYDLDNSYTANYNIETKTYETGHETTFDRIERSYTVVGSADYSINGIAFNQINNQTVSYVNSLGGLDGKTDFVDGETLIFTQQENFPASVGLYNGWVYPGGSIVPGFIEFENSQKYPIGTPGLPSSPQVGQVADVDGVFYMFTADRDASGNVLDTVWKVANLRASVWTINIDSNNIITLTPATFQRTVGVGSSAVKVPSTTMTGDFIQINYGVQHSESLVFYNPVITIGISVPAFDFIITRLNPSTSVTRFDGYGTKFLEYKTIYETPETNDSWLIFPTNGPLL